MTDTPPLPSASINQLRQSVLPVIERLQEMDFEEFQAFCNRMTPEDRHTFLGSLDNILPRNVVRNAFPDEFTNEPNTLPTYEESQDFYYEERPGLPRFS